MREPLWLPDAIPLSPEGAPIVSQVRVKRSPLDRIRAEQRAPRDWERKLRSYWPVSDSQQWLHLRMFPEAISKKTGEPISGSARWVLYTMTPPSLIFDQTRLAMMDELPWWELPEDQQFGRMMMVTSYQYAMWKEYRCLARPYWCLQGSEGGTPMQYTMREQAILRAQELPTDVPNPGDLPFAPLDERVIQALQARDKFRQLGGALDRMRDPEKAAADVRNEEQEAEIVFRTEFVKWFKARMEPNAEFIAAHLRKSENATDFRPATRNEANAADQWEDQYIATGTVPFAAPE